MNSRILFTALLFFGATPAMAADQQNGSELHTENCTRCHDSSVYTRDNRRVQSLPKLGTQVRFCKDNLGVAWFDDEVDDVIHYLNSQYYKF
jgi:mono/diheme cytochrome c family protein